VFFKTTLFLIFSNLLLLLQSLVSDPIVSPVIPQDVKKSSASSTKSRKKRGSSGTIGKQLFFQTSEKASVVTQVSDTVADPSFDLCRIDTADRPSYGSLLKTPDSVKSVTPSVSKVSATDSKAINRKVVAERNVRKELCAESAVKPKPLTARFQYGNYNQYYGYRNPNKFEDSRMSCLEKDWFKGMVLLFNLMFIYHKFISSMVVCC